MFPASTELILKLTWLLGAALSRLSGLYKAMQKSTEVQSVATLAWQVLQQSLLCSEGWCFGSPPT